MTRRGWLLLLGGAMGSGVISACTHTIAGGDTTSTRPNEKQAASEALQRKPTSAILTSQPKSEHPEERAAPATAPVLDLLPPERPVVPKPPPKPEPPITSAKPLEAAAPVRPPVKEPVLITALRAYLDGRHSAAFALLSQCPPENQELLLRLFPLLERLTDVGREPAGPEWGVIANQLETALISLRARAELSIEKLCFVSHCNGFGMYDPLPAAHQFEPGQRVKLYVEVRNFSNTTRRGPDGRERYAINLAGRIEIRDFNGHTLKTIPVQREQRNESLSPWHDYCDVYNFWLPRDLPPDSYTLVVQVTDEATKRAAKPRTLDFHVGNNPGRATLAQEPGAALQRSER